MKKLFLTILLSTILLIAGDQIVFASPIPYQNINDKASGAYGLDLVKFFVFEMQPCADSGKITQLEVEYGVGAAARTATFDGDDTGKEFSQFSREITGAPGVIIYRIRIQNCNNNSTVGLRITANNDTSHPQLFGYPNLQQVATPDPGTPPSVEPGALPPSVAPGALPPTSVEPGALPPSVADDCGDPGKVDSVCDVLKILDRLTNWMFTIFIAAAVIFILLAAFKYLTAGGGEETAKAHKMLLYSAVAIAVAILAKGIVKVIQTIVSV